MARVAADDDATISAVNYSEVPQKAARVGIAAEEIDSALDELAITVTPFGRLNARLAASFYRHRSNLSLADRMCLPLGVPARLARRCRAVVRVCTRVAVMAAPPTVAVWAGS